MEFQNNIHNLENLELGRCGFYNTSVQQNSEDTDIHLYRHQNSKNNDSSSL